MDARSSAVRVIVHGDVQGVGFRANARAVARRLALCGSAANRRDGTVDVRLEGDPAAIDRMLEWLRVGPRYATVSSIEVEPQEATGLEGFTLG